VIEQPSPKLCIPRVTQEFFPKVSGPANQVLAIAAGLERRNISSPVVTTTPGLSKAVESSGVTVHRFQPILSLPNFRVSIALIGWLNRAHPSLVHIHGWRNPVSDLAILQARYSRTPFVVQAHGVAFGHQYSDGPLFIRVLRKLYDRLIRGLVTRNAVSVIASTRLEADELAQYGFAESKIVVIPVGVSNSYFAEASRSPTIDTDSFTLLTVGRIGARRNIEQMIEALALLRAMGIKAQLRIVGPEVSLTAGDKLGYRQRLENLAAACGISGAVTFVGPRSGNDLINEYRSASIFVYTTLYENFGQPITEAAASGLPIVATPTGVAVEFLEDGAAGTLVPFQDSSATASAILRLCTNEQLRHRCGQVARERAKSMFSWEAIIPQYETLYRELARPSNAQPGARKMAGE
jgi:glycosyltransferase involved in cell wall biosynthesis